MFNQWAGARKRLLNGTSSTLSSSLGCEASIATPRPHNWQLLPVTWEQMAKYNNDNKRWTVIKWHFLHIWSYGQSDSWFFRLSDQVQRDFTKTSLQGAANYYLWLDPKVKLVFLGQAPLVFRTAASGQASLTMGQHGGRHWKATQYKNWHTHITWWNRRRLEITKTLYMPTHGEIVDRMVPEIHPIQFKVISYHTNIVFWNLCTAKCE